MKRKKRGTKRGPGKRGKKKMKRKSVPQKLKDYIKWRSRGRCEYCGMPFSGSLTLGTGKVGPELHHIDGNRANIKKDNLIRLCPNHHNMADNGEITEGELRNCISRFRFRL